MNKKRKAGFTLVELIVVIAILGILAAVAIPAYNGYIKKAHEAADIAKCDAIKTAAIAACAEYGAVTKVEITKENDNIKVSVTCAEINANAFEISSESLTEEKQKAAASNYSEYIGTQDLELSKGITKAEWPTSADDNSWKFTPEP